jgi:hypothetical protein
MTEVAAGDARESRPGGMLRRVDGTERGVGVGGDMSEVSGVGEA